MKKLALRLGLKDKGSDGPDILSKAPVQSDPTGLHVLYAPEGRPTVDIIFVHGLGGASRRSWCKDGDLALFWPQEFLPYETDIRLGRILTYGYDADWRKGSSVSIRDFGNDLLFDLAYTKDQHTGELDIGSAPIIFVAHDIGGIVVKEAYVKSQRDFNYRHIHKSIVAMLFLSTPHRGSNLAVTLNRLLAMTMLSPPPYIADISASSINLQRVLDEFRHVASEVQIVSFYETRQTAVGLKRVLVVEKDSAVMGWPGEISKALDTDHRGMCKFYGTEDPNYIAVRNVLRSVISKALQTKALNQGDLQSRSMPTTPIKLYGPLSFENAEIRLLTLLPEIDNSCTICCTIENISLIDPPNYKALSYCWGDPNVVETIKVNGIDTKATTNLVLALRQLRSYGRVTLWVDALCINQEDREERALQVQRMKDIFSQAIEVIVWVGPEDDHSPKALDFMEQMEMESSTDERPGYKKLYNKESPTESWKACDNFFSRPFWSRAWIIQEIAVASKLRVQCGERMVSWDAVARGLSHTRLVDLNGFRESVRGSQLRTLLQALYDSRTSLATESRDKIYALLGLTVDGNDIIRLPNYRQPIEVVLTQTTKSILLRTRKLDIITLRLPKHVNSPGLPSWVPDWTRLGDIVRPWQVQHLYSQKQAIGSAETWTKDGFEIDGSDLTVTGLVCGTIDKLSTSFCKSGRHYSLMPDSEGGDLSFAVKYLSDTLTIFGVFNEAGVDALLYWAYQDLQHWIKENQTILQEAGYDHLLDGLFRSLQQPFASWYSEEMEREFQETGQRSPKHVLDTIEGIFEGGTKLLITADGNCGLGHPQARQGDIICVIASSSTPVILRKSGDAWKLIGEGYLDKTQPHDTKLTHSRNVHRFVLR